MGVSIYADLTAELKQIQADIQADKTKYKAQLVDMSAPIPDADYLFKFGDVCTIPRGELIAITAKWKQGKSQMQYYLTAVMLACAPRGIVKPVQDKYKVLLFDTEQSMRDIQVGCQRALQFAGLPTDKNDVRFQPYYLRPLSIEERKRTIEDAVEAEHPDIIFIDGIRDLLKDFNNLDQSGDLIQWLLHLTAEYGCTVVCILHQNKGREDTNMRGHLGTELVNKVSDCFEVSKKDGKFIVSCVVSRHLTAPDFAFSINAEGHYQVEDATQPDRGAARAADIQRVLRLCFRDTDAMSYGDLVRRYMEEGAVSEPTAKRHIKEAKDHDFISVSNGLYSLIPNGG